MSSEEEDERAARATFWIIAVVAVVAIRYWNREQWFFLDDWESLAGRRVVSLDDLLQPHNEHWSTIPIVAYRAVWRVVGLHHYWPYQMVTIAFHVLGAAMVRTIARRAGAAPWLATSAAVALLWFGAGRDAIAWGINGFTIAIALGLAAIVLSDRSRGSVAGDAAAGSVCLLASIHRWTA